MRRGWFVPVRGQLLRRLRRSLCLQGRRWYQVFDCAGAEAWSCLPMLLWLQQATAGMRRGRHVDFRRGPLQHLRRLPRLRERWQHQVLSLPRLRRHWRKIQNVWLPTRGETGLGFGSHLLWWFSSPSGFVVVRCAGALVLEASGSSVSDDMMADGHPFQLCRSAVTKQVGVDMLHKTATKKTLFLRQRGGRLQAVCSGRRQRGMPGGVYKDRVVFSFLSRVFL